jgi:hypothetical protein
LSIAFKVLEITCTKFRVKASVEIRDYYTFPDSKLRRLFGQYDAGYQIEHVLRLAKPFSHIYRSYDEYNLIQ